MYWDGRFLVSEWKESMTDVSLNSYVVLIRGINVGGKNIIPMADLRKCLDEQGFFQVSTYIASGNVILKSEKHAADVKSQIEDLLPKYFSLVDGFVKVLVLTHHQLQLVIDNKPHAFGEQPETYDSDVIFLMGLDPSQVMQVFDPREGVDKIWPGDGVIYAQRLSAQRAKSRLTKIMGTAAYKSLTIRNWNTTTKLLQIMKNMDAG